MAKKIPSAPSNLEAKSNNPQALRVLIVEDSKDDVLLIIRELKKGGYNPVYERVETAATMKKALQEKQWDIILCDYKMPKFNAPSAIAVLKETNIDIPLIIVSGAIGEETAVECMRLGAQDYIMKGNMSRVCPAIVRELEDAASRRKRKQAEDALRETEERYRALFDRSLDLVYIFDFEGRFIDANDRALNRLGYTREEIRSLNFASLLSEDQLPLAVKNTQEIQETGFQNSLEEYRLRHKNGHDVYVETQGSAIISNGKPVAIQAIARDITERKQTEQALQDSTRENAFQAELLRKAPVIAAFHDRDQNIIWANQAYEEATGVSLQDIAGKKCYSVWNLSGPCQGCPVLPAITTGQPCEAELTPQNQEYWPESQGYWLSKASPVRDQEGSIIGAIEIAIDITERKQAEKKIEKQNVYIKMIMDNVPVGIATNEIDSMKVTYMNRKFSELYGWPEDEFPDVGSFFEKVFPELEYRQQMQTRILADLASGDMERMNWDDLKITTKTGDQRTVHAVNIPLPDQNIMVSTVQDITERKQAEAKIKQTLESLKKAVGTTIQVMVSAVEMRDPYTAGHQIRVANLACAIATEMGLAQEKIKGISMAGSIHDIGKLSIPAELLSKPTKLTDIEFFLVKEHAKSGYEILKDVESDWPLAQIVYQHHERMDGSGYPRNLKGEDIIMEARIMAVADVVEAMASHRPYRPSMGIDVALAEIEKNRGTYYDNTVVDACLRLFREKGYQLPTA